MKIWRRRVCSRKLIMMLEENAHTITHPLIAAWIAREYRMDVSEYNGLVHRIHRVKTMPEPVEWWTTGNVMGV